MEFQLDLLKQDCIQSIQADIDIYLTIVQEIVGPENEELLEYFRINIESHYNAMLAIMDCAPTIPAVLYGHATAQIHLGSFMINLLGESEEYSFVVARMFSNLLSNMLHPKISRAVLASISGEFLSNLSEKTTSFDEFIEMIKNYILNHKKEQENGTV